MSFNYFEEFDGNQVQNEEEENLYDDDETFGDTGPLNNEWENNHNLLSTEHEDFLHKNQLRKANSFNDDENDTKDDDDEEETGNGVHNPQQHHRDNHQSFSQFSQTTRRVTGVFNSLSIDDDSSTNEMIDEESVFKIAMGESAFEHHKHTTTTTTTTTHHIKPQEPINPLLKLMSQIPVDQQTVDHELLKNRFSVSDLEAKYNNNIDTEVDDEEEPLTPQKLNKTDQQQQQQQQQQHQESPKQQYYKNKYSRPPPITLGDMVPGNAPQQAQQGTQSNRKQYQQQQQQQQNQNLSPRTNKFKSKPHQQNQGGNNNSSNNSSNTTITDKKYMSADEIQSINRLQSYQIHFTNPYIEDYYYQRFRMKTTIPSHTHTPICDSQPKTTPVKKPGQGSTADPLSGALGRIPTHSIRAPRQILQIILSNEDSAQDSSSPQDKNQKSDQTIKLVVESSYSHILDLDDINLLISITQDQTLLSEYMQKRETVSQALFQSLHLDPFPSFKFESPQLPPQDPNQKWPSVCPEDLLFVSLWVIAKGRKLLKRAFPMLTDKQSLSGLFAVCRNLPLLLLLHLPEGSEQSTESIYQTVVKWIMDVPIKFFILGFHFLVNFNQSKFIVKLLDSKPGRSIVHAFLARGILLHDPNYLMKSGFILEPIDNEQWRDVFDRFFLRLSGSFLSIFPPTNTPSMELSQLFSLIFGNSSDKQRQQIQMELGSV